MRAERERERSMGYKTWKPLLSYVHNEAALYCMDARIQNTIKKEHQNMGTLFFPTDERLETLLAEYIFQQFVCFIPVWIVVVFMW